MIFHCHIDSFLPNKVLGHPGKVYKQTDTLGYVFCVHSKTVVLWLPGQPLFSAQLPLGQAGSTSKFVSKLVSILQLHNIYY